MITLREATANDIPMLQKWVAEPHVRSALGVEPAPDWDFEFAEAFDWHDPLIAECDGRPIGYIEIIDPAKEVSHYWGDVGPGLRALDIWIGDAADLGRGYGAAMMEQALERCFRAHDVKAVIIDPLASNTRAIAFYERLGFAKERLQEFDGNLCQVMRLTRDRWRVGC